MPITELVFPTYKSDTQSLAELQDKQPDIAQVFTSGFDGLLTAYRGVPIEENGVAIEDTRLRSIYAFEWVDASAFHAVFPNSEKFQKFAKLISSFVAAKPVPEIYEAEGQVRATSCFAAPVTQIIKAKSGKETEEAWKRLEVAIEEQGFGKPSFYHANGIEKDEDIFLGLIGWNSLQEYERGGKNKSVLECFDEMGNGHKISNIITQLCSLKST